jgi:hypothetical protein
MYIIFIKVLSIAPVGVLTYYTGKAQMGDLLKSHTI